MFKGRSFFFMEAWLIIFIVIAIVALCAGAAISVSRAASKSTSAPQYHPRVETSSEPSDLQQNSGLASAPYSQENNMPYPQDNSLPYPSFPSETQNLPYPTNTQNMPVPLIQPLPYPTESQPLPYPTEPQGLPFPNTQPNIIQPPPLPQLGFYNAQQPSIGFNSQSQELAPYHLSSAPSSSFHDPPPPYNPFMNSSADESNTNTKF